MQHWAKMISTQLEQKNLYIFKIGSKLEQYVKFVHLKFVQV